MTTLPDRPNSALVVIDVQNDVVADSVDRDVVLENINALVKRARAAGVDVVWVQHHDDNLVRDTEGWSLVPELVPTESEPVVHKSYGDSLGDTDLESVLAERGVGALIVTGAQTDACVRSTLHGGFVRGYDVTLVSDAHTTEDLRPYGAPAPEAVVAHTNLYWQYQTAPGRRAEVVPAESIEF
ncbi:MAG: isochorismatase family protein [Acidimicrobiales bacterium]|nr:isochorismatase family protein [Acidimicrobiales bacterium]